MNHKTALACLCLATFFFSMCADVEEGAKGAETAAKDVTLKDIMSNPSAYAGRTVSIKGVCSFAYQGLSPCGKKISEKMSLTMGEPMSSGLGLDISDGTNVHMCIFKSTIPSPYPIQTDIVAEVKVIDGYPYLTNVISKAVHDPYVKE
jgi:hypothetical protein